MSANASRDALTLNQSLTVRPTLPSQRDKQQRYKSPSPLENADNRECRILWKSEDMKTVHGSPEGADI